MNFTENNGKLIIKIEGRIDSNNAADAEKEILGIVNAHESMTIIFDAENLEYISSAGLRVLLKVIKLSDEPIEVQNVSKDVYEIFEITGFTELLDVKKALRKVSIKNCEAIGRGGHGKVYRLDDETIIKVYHDNSPLSLIQKEREYAKNAFVNGIPSAIAYDVVQTEEGYGVIFEMAGATTVSKYIMEHPDKLSEYAVKFGSLLKTLNTTEADPSLYGDIKQIYLGRAKKAEKYFTDEENAKIVKMINSIPDGSGMIHGDYHTNNVMVQSDGEFVLIDMADISRGNALFDIGGTFLTMYLSGMNDPDITLQTIGIEYEMSKKVWGIMLSTYYGTTDSQKLELISKRCGAFALLRMATTLGIGTKRAEESSAKIVEILRQQLFPNADDLCRLFAMPV